MKRQATLFIFVATAAWGQLSPAARPAAGTVKPLATVNPPATAGVPRKTLGEVERMLDTRLMAIGIPNDPIDTLGLTRGIYITGFGAVFSSELSVIITPGTNPFGPQPGPALAKVAHERKVARMPALRAAMLEMMKIAGRTLNQMPETQQIVLSIRLPYLVWEDISGLPGEIVMRADRKSAAAGIVQTEER